MLCFEYAVRNLKISKIFNKFSLIFKIFLVLTAVVLHVLQYTVKNYCKNDSSEEFTILKSWISKLEMISFYIVCALILITSFFILYMKYDKKWVMMQEIHDRFIHHRYSKLERRISTSTEDSIDSLVWWMILFLSIEIILLIVAKYTKNINYALFLLG